MLNNELEKYLINLQRDNCFRVDAVLKESPHEVTERGFFLDSNQEPSVFYIRKRIAKSSGIGLAYQRLFDAQSRGLYFTYLPKITLCFEADDQLIVVMEYIDGKTLDVDVSEGGVSLERAGEVFPLLCDAVSELHKSFDPPLIHRDLKPSNIMLLRGSLKIVDFGISRTYKKDADQDTCYFGTKAYAPPEQFGYGQTDERSDIYSLGMLLYFCLRGEHPDQKMRRDEFRSEWVPESLRLIIKKATSFDPSARHASAQELKDSFLVAYRTLEKKKRQKMAAELRKTQRIQKNQLMRETQEHLGERVSVSYYYSSLSPLLKLSFVAGILWNVCLVLWVALVARAVWVSCFGAASEYPLTDSIIINLLVHASFAFHLFVLPCYLVCDRRSLRCIFPWIPRWNLKRDILMVVLVLLCGFSSYILFYLFLTFMGFV